MAYPEFLDIRYISLYAIIRGYILLMARGKNYCKFWVRLSTSYDRAAFSTLYNVLGFIIPLCWTGLTYLPTNDNIIIYLCT